MRTQELNRVGTTHETVLNFVKEHIAFLDEEIAALKKEIADVIKKDLNLKTKADRSPTVHTRNWRGYHCCYSFGDSMR
jgi:hypothetical protein